MSAPAQVHSSDAIDAFRVAVALFEERVQGSIESLESQLQRAVDWIENERPAHWRRQLREAEDGVHDAKMELERCLMMTVAGDRPTCREQKDAVQQWKLRVEYCREKLESVRKWQRSFKRELLENHGRLGQLRRVVEFDLPQARGVLTKIVRQIDQYQLERPPEAIHVPAATEQSAGAGGTATHVRTTETPQRECEAPAEHLET